MNFIQKDVSYKKNLFIIYLKREKHELTLKVYF
jgi:hypothetical protein